MAISRPFLLAVLGVILLGATALAVQNARDTSDNASTPAVVQSDAAPAPAPAQQTATTDAADTLKAAFDLKDLHRARFQATYSVVNQGRKVRLTFRGAFDSTGDTPIPRFWLTTDSFVNGVDKGSGHLVSLGDRAYLVRGDTGWRLPSTLWSEFAGRVKSGEKQKLPINIQPATWVRDVKSKGTERIAGVETEHVTARIDLPAMFNDLGAPLAAAVPKRTLERNIKRARLDVWVGKEDQILRRFDAQLVGRDKNGIHFDVRLAGVNKPQRIEAPAHVRAGMPSAAVASFGNFVTSQIGSAGTPSYAALVSPNPGRAARAVHNHRKVVILFTNSRGLDDRRMAAVIREVDGRTKALVLSDPVDAVDRYGKLIQDLGVSETPSVVIIGSSGKAKLLEGYYDADTLTQAVADAR
jgi:hypothetical protein